MQTTLQSQVFNPERLRVLYRLCLLDSPTNPAFDRLTRLASAVLRAPISLVSLVDVDHQFFKSFVGLKEPYATTRETPLSHSFCQHVIDSGEALVIEDARQHALVKDNPAIADMNVIAYAGIPLITSEAQALGSFCVIDEKPRHWADADVELLKELAAAVMTEIELRAEIMEREKAERALQYTQDRLQEALAAAREANLLKSQFISMASHEFRTPLAVINLSSSILYAPATEANADKRTRHFEQIQTSITKMTNLLDDVLALGKGETGSAHFKPERLDASALCIDTIETVTAGSTKGQPITFTEVGTPIEVLLDREQFQTLLQNLLVNAAKYSSRTAAIEVELAYTLSELRLRVNDHGIGIPPADQARLFEPFYRASNSSGIQGTGLGLAIVKRAVDLHGGTIEVESRSGEGTTFIVTLPLRR